ncbi:MAG: helix-turn-helix domain-containing protein [Patescibacteria group bacterium]
MNIGLNRKEAQVYYALLQLGQSSAQAVAQKAGLKRPTTYLILGELMQRSLVLKVPKLRKQMFIAKSPRAFVAAAEERLQATKAMLPALEAATKAQEKVRTLYFEGVSGIREALFYRIPEFAGTEINAFFGNSKAASDALNQVFHEWNAKVFQVGATIRSIVPKAPFLEQFRKQDTAYNFLSKIVPPDLYTSRCSIDITPFFVRVILFKEEQAVIIESPDAARAMKEIFEMVYRQE